VTVEWSDTALQRLKELLMRNTEEAWHAYDRIEERVLQLEQLPKLKALPRRGRRVLVVTGTPYLIIYTVEQEVIRIRAIRDAREKAR
jgi:plasmid stabilization system protein ParE